MILTDNCHFAFVDLARWTIAIILAFTISGFATDINGLISMDQTWTKSNNPYIITGNTLIGSGSTLTIESGVVVKFNKGTILQINGMLIAQGTLENEIHFTSNSDEDTAGYWNSIHLANSTNAVLSKDLIYQSGTIIEYAIVEYGGGANSTGAIQVSSCAVYMNHITVRHSASAGVSLFGGGSTVVNSTLEENGSHGISVSGTPGATLKDNIVKDNNGDGISAGSSGLITGNIVSGNKGDGIAGYCHESGLEIMRNITIGNAGIGIILDGCLMSISKNIVVSNTLGGICLKDDGSIASQNIIANNSGRAYQGKDCCNGNLINSLIYSNTSADYTVYLSSYATTKSFSYNTVISNTAPTTIFVFNGGSGGPNSLHHCNIHNKAQNFELSNSFGSATTVKADTNWWGSYADSTIQKKIFDWFDDATTAVVQYQPYLTTKDTIAPISPPDSVVKLMVEGKVALHWKTNTEADVAGYKVYYSSPTGYSFSKVKDVGTASTFVLDSATISDTIAVTAYDNMADGSDDLFEGHESWFAVAVDTKGTNIFKTTPNAFAFRGNNGVRYIPGKNTIEIAPHTADPITIRVYTLNGVLIKDICYNSGEKRSYHLDLGRYEKAACGILVIETRCNSQAFRELIAQY